jgi:putative phosphoesterase
LSIYKLLLLQTPDDPRPDAPQAPLGQPAPIDTSSHADQMPTRLAVITDIHANLPALEASLAAIEAEGVDGVLCGGDLVGYGPHPNEVCRLIEDLRIPTIYGNYDYAIGRDLEDCGCAYVTKHDRELGQLSVAWTLAHTDDRSKGFMRGLPFDLRLELGDQRVRLVHGSPRKVNEYLFEDKPARLYERLAAQAECDTLVFGHTHKPWIHEYGGVLFVNCGSVGKPKDGDPRCAFAILELDEEGEVRASIRRAGYDAEAVAREVAAAGLPGEYAQKLVAAA